MVCSMDGSFSIFYLASDIRVYIKLSLWRLIGYEFGKQKQWPVMFNLGFYVIIIVITSLHRCVSSRTQNGEIIPCFM